MVPFFFFLNPSTPEENLDYSKIISDPSCFFLGGKNSYWQAASCAASVQLWTAVGHTVAKTIAILNSPVLESTAEISLCFRQLD